MKRSFTAVVLAVLVVFLALSGCSREDSINSPEDYTAPELPPPSTMSMDLSTFDGAQGDMQALGAGRESKLNFINAALRVHVIQMVVCVALVKPVAAFTLAVRSVPQPQSDGSWLWTYIFVDDAIEYSVFLYGKNMGDYIEWRMEVSSTDPGAPFDHFLWFEGEVERYRDSGYWQFYEPEDDPPAAVADGGDDLLATPGVQCIRIDWENREDDEHELVFLVNKPGIPEEGSTLTYLETPTGSSLDFLDARTDETGIISWYPDGSGSIRWPDYKHGELCCWDTSQFNTECPE